jgi:hypothetical protein
MKNKYVKINFLVLIVMVFAICYQSLHIFIDETHHQSEVTHTKNIKAFSYKKLYKEKEECPVCEFEFAAFLSSEIFSFKFINLQSKFHFIDNYISIVKEKEFLFYSHRGPPLV